MYVKGMGDHPLHLGGAAIAELECKHLRLLCESDEGGEQRQGAGEHHLDPHPPYTE